MVLHHHAEALADLHRFDEAAPPAREAVALYQDHPDWTPHEAAHAVAVLTTIALATGHADEALSAIHTLLAAHTSRLAPGSAEQSAVLGPAGLSLERIGTLESAREAVPLLRQCLVIRSKTFPDGHPQQWQRYEVASSLGGALVIESQDPALAPSAHLEKLHEAEPLLTGSYAAFLIDANAPPRLRHDTALRLIALYVALEREQPDNSQRDNLEKWKATATSSAP
jgi:hypothetical protein